MRIAVATYPGMTALDAVGPYEVFAHVPGAHVIIAAAHRGHLEDDHGRLRLHVEHTFDEIETPDVVLVPGGLGTRRLIRDGHPVIDWIRRVHPTTTYTTSVCTGALLLGAAGLLDGRRATTHWTAYDTLRTFGAHPTEQRVVEDGKIITSAGVSAGIDLALTVVARLTEPDVARAIQLGIEYDPQPPFDSGAPSKAPDGIVELVRAVTADAEQRLLDRPDAEV